MQGVIAVTKHAATVLGVVKVTRRAGRGHHLPSIRGTILGLHGRTDVHRLRRGHLQVHPHRSTVQTPIRHLCEGCCVGAAKISAAPASRALAGCFVKTMLVRRQHPGRDLRLPGCRRETRWT
jgi:hypothetical protein